MASDANVEMPPRRKRGTVVWPMLLIGFGTLFLLNNLGIVPWSFWGQIWRLWPVVLILIGLELLFGGRLRRMVLGMVAVGLVFVGVAFIVGGQRFDGVAAGPQVTRQHEQPLQGATEADVHVEFGAGHLEVGALAAGGDKLAAMTYDGPAELAPEPRFVTSGGRAELRYDLEGEHNRMHINPVSYLSGRVPSATLRVNVAPEPSTLLRFATGAAESRLDLSKLRVRQFDLETGASKTWLRLPEAGGVTAATIEAGAASIEIEVPEGVAAQVRYEGGLSNIEVANPRLRRTRGEGSYATDDFATNPNRVDLRIETGASSVTIR